MRMTGYAMYPFGDSPLTVRLDASSWPGGEVRTMFAAHRDMAASSGADVWNALDSREKNAQHCGVATRASRVLEATLLATALLAVYLSNGKTLGSGDTLPARYLPLSLLRDGSFYLDAFPVLYDERAQAGRIDGLPYYLVRARGHYVSWYPVGAPLLAVPIYLPAVLTGIPTDDAGLAVLEKVSAAVIVAVSALLLYLLLRRLTTRPLALALVTVYGLGTSNLSVSSQALWQHGPSQLALVAALYCLVRAREESGWAAFAGFPLAFSVVVRPVNVLVALPLAAYAVLKHQRHALGLVASALPAMAFQLWYNAVYFDDVFHTQLSGLTMPLWQTSLVEGLTGLLLSPGRGLLVYSPVLVLSLAGMVRAWRSGGDPLLRALSVGAVLTILLYSKWAKWWGGYTYGPRLLADLSPVFVLAMLPLAERLLRHRTWQVAFALLAAWSIGAHAMGAFVDDHVTWNQQADVEAHPDRLWRWGDNQLVNSLRTFWGPGDAP
jgi:Dolichyl-phosphate-mannose-protein mannosyltransferase